MEMRMSNPKAHVILALGVASLRGPLAAFIGRSATSLVKNWPTNPQFAKNRCHRRQVIGISDDLVLTEGARRRLAVAIIGRWQKENGQTLANSKGTPDE